MRDDETADREEQFDPDDAHFAEGPHGTWGTGGMRAVADQHEQDRDRAQAVETLDALCRLGDICGLRRRRASALRRRWDLGLHAGDHRLRPSVLRSLSMSLHSREIT